MSLSNPILILLLCGWLSYFRDLLVSFTSFWAFALFQNDILNITVEIYHLEQVQPILFDVKLIFTLNGIYHMCPQTKFR